MNCYDCSKHGNDTPAVGVCHDCGAGVCGNHANTDDLCLTRMVAIGVPVAVEPPARVIRCATCSNAFEALRDAKRPRRHRSHTTQPTT